MGGLCSPRGSGARARLLGPARPPHAQLDSFCLVRPLRCTHARTWTQLPARTHARTVTCGNPAQRGPEWLVCRAHPSGCRPPACAWLPSCPIHPPSLLGKGCHPPAEAEVCARGLQAEATGSSGGFLASHFFKKSKKQTTVCRAGLPTGRLSEKTKRVFLNRGASLGSPAGAVGPRGLPSPTRFCTLFS